MSDLMTRYGVFAGAAIKIPIVDYLVIAGGGCGGQGDSSDYTVGAGGAGGYLEDTNLELIAKQSYTVTVGAGGVSGNNGQNSVFGNLISIGGGHGAHPNEAAGNGGSGGGARVWDAPGGTGVAGQGNRGGQAGNYNAGGGAGSAAGSYSNPGNGKQSSITGTALWYAGGGGAVGPGKHGGGTGNPLINEWWDGSGGAANTGGGGGMYFSSFGNRGRYPGGSGVVILRFLTGFEYSIGSGLTYNAIIDGDYTVLRFTSGSGTISFK